MRKIAVCLLLACVVCAAPFAQTPEDCFNRGKAHLDTGNYDRAVADFTEAIALNPRYIEAYLGRGLAYFLKRHYIKAIADLEAVLTIEPDNADVKEFIELIREGREN